MFYGLKEGEIQDEWVAGEERKEAVMNSRDDESCKTLRNTSNQR